ncbi:conserved hypothetical protein [Planktothrix sp. PCC 11201]|uniref:DUF2358 domain-containing protein n=1 Tax=Planktothrix sp. PCC 11201 TaxID=1729650 RepID=UPI00091435CD|nr:DUF2358 domain-containing protein [Planktothrix sp. PCC 11201]SKB11229.1 conserved hypothetical protein [Planktothrix sp. PCC 11201]
MDIIEIIKQDYQQFPDNQTYSIYADNVYFADPMNQFNGLQRYQQMIGFMKTWFLEIQLDLHNITQTENLIETRWTLSWTTPLPWKPRISIPGRSELKLNPHNLIESHIDYWDCSRLDVVKQLFSMKNRYS